MLSGMGDWIVALVPVRVSRTCSNRWVCLVDKGYYFSCFHPEIVPKGPIQQWK